MKFLAAATLFTAALAAPSQSKREVPSQIDPVLSQFNVRTGAVNYATGQGVINKDGQGPDITTLVKFEFPASTKGYNCELHFPLDHTAAASGSKQTQIFSSLELATHTTTTWPQGNMRGNHLADAKFTAPGGVTFEATYGAMAKGKFPCPAGMALGAEIVGIGERVYIQWTQGPNAGPYIEVTA